MLSPLSSRTTDLMGWLMPSKPIYRFDERRELARHPLARRLFALMVEKETNLAVSADITHADDLLDLVYEVGPHVCVVKTHIDTLVDFEPRVVERLQDLASRFGFLIFEDRKFADIGNTVMHQYSEGIYRIADWADITNAHILPGPGIIEGLKQAAVGRERGLLLLAQMSSAGNMLHNAYTQTAVDWAEQHPDFVMGFICTEKVSTNPGMIHFSPGCQLAPGGDGLGQSYLTPAVLVGERRSDVPIVGRGITQAQDPAAMAREYREQCWEAYQNRLL